MLETIKFNFMKKIIYLSFCFILSLSLSFAQTSDNPWAVSVGANLVGIQDDSVDSDTGFGLPALSLSRYISSGLSLGAQWGANSLDINSVSIDYYSLDGIIKYNISEGNTVPYLFGGYGLTSFNDGFDREGMFPSNEVARTYLGGVGVNFFVSDNWAIAASTSYRSASENGAYNHLQHVIGVSYNFGSQDTDKDGVSDKKDACPEVPGLKEFDGCPDGDSDGIPDNKDACPEEAGSADLNGCPDSDGDGVADNEDACPDAAGSAEMGGCPDSDGDGVSDKDDACPNQAGENNGCPWPDSDGDGVLDKDDACPNEAGTDNGCPDKSLPQELTDFLNSDKSKIMFMISSSRISKGGSAKLSEIKALMEKFADAVLTIEGHASSDGPTDYNQKLSERRAKAVKDALVSMGVDASRLNTAAFGETRPAADNNTSEGRASNRRVEFDRRVEIKVKD